MTIEHLCQDLETVVDTLGLDHFVLLSAGHIGTVAILYACRHPERVEALALLHCGLNAPFSPAALFKEVPSQSWDVLLHNLLPRGLPTEEREASLRILRASMTAADYATHLSAVISYDRLRQLELLTTPALVMHVRDFPHLPVEESMSLASQIQDARFMLIPGETMYGDGTTIVDAIEGFLATLPINGQAATKSPPSSPSDLSERELSVLRLIATGRSNQQIADELVISVNTVIRHVSNIFAKTGAANRAQATAYAKDHGIA
jgi:DNA-binding CsgD family transcriptional regulator